MMKFNHLRRSEFPFKGSSPAKAEWPVDQTDCGGGGEPISKIHIVHLSTGPIFRP
jgi:hypothetical protein